MSALVELELWAFLGLALAGGLHCAGMCGGFAIAVAVGGTQGLGARLGRLSSFALGKALTYATLGALVASSLDGLARLAPDASLSAARRTLSALAAVGLIGFGLHQLGWRPLSTARRSGLVELVRPWSERARALGGQTGAFATGLLAGFLPCGLSWSALALAVSHAAPVAAVQLFVFGLGTAPALLLFGCSWGALPARALPALRTVSGVSLLVFGALLAQRALQSGPRPCGCDAHAAPKQAAPREASAERFPEREALSAAAPQALRIGNAITGTSE